MSWPAAHSAYRLNALFDMLLRWPEAITQAVLQTPPDKDPLDELPRIWRWNIYVAEIKEKLVTMDKSIDDLALELVREFIPDMEWEFSSHVENQVAQGLHSVEHDVARWGFERIMRQRVKKRTPVTLTETGVSNAVRLFRGQPKSLKNAARAERISASTRDPLTQEGGGISAIIVSPELPRRTM